MFLKYTLGLTLALGLSFSSLSVIAEAAKGGNGRKPAPSGTDSFSLDLLNSTDGLPHWGQQVTFTTTATTYPHVSLQCSQNGVLVYNADAGYYAGYPWPWEQTMTLASAAWTGGAADCVATLYYFSGAKTVVLGTMSIHVYQ